MSDIFGTPRQPKPSGGGGVDRRRRVLVPTLVTLALLLFLGSIFTSVWTDRLWYKSVDYSGVFSTIVITRVGLFLTLGLVFGLVVALNVYLAHRFRPKNPSVRRDDPAYRYRTAMDPIRKPALLVLTLVVTAFAGSVAQSRWDTFQQWRHGTSFGIKDPQFGKDQSFYVFDLPWLRFLSSFSFAMIVVAVLVTLFVHYIYGGVRLAGRGPSFTRAAQVHLSVLIGFGVLLRAFGYWLDRYGYMVKASGVVHGGTFTDINARIPSRNILIAVAIVCALLFFATIFLKSWVLPGIGLGLMLVTSVLLGGVWPYVMQSFQVKPSEPDKEAPYIARNIEATREAYGVKDTEVEQYSAETKLTPRELNESAEDRVSSRLLDPTLISPAFQQLQQVRGYYTVPDTLDVDRYTLGKDKSPQDVIIAAREVDLDGLQDSQRNWANDHTVYTHGYGVIAARGNQRGDQGEPVWVEKDIPPVGDIPTKVPPRIYFGENTPSYSIVGQPKGADPIEVDIPRGGGSASNDDDGKESATQNTYDGKGGVPVGNIFNKVLYAFKFAEPNIVLSSRVNSASKILYDRNPRDRVKKVAPWLTVDGDTYPSVVDGRVVWIVDGYTTSNSYAYSEHRSLREATDDTLTQGRTQAALPTDQVNYMRNSVKAVVDAYDGSVKLYEWDEKDPVLKTWMKVFPNVVEPKSEISDDLKAHLRYPVDLFKVQRDVLSRYHVTDAKTFYEGGERWKIPEDPAGTRNSLQPPYFLSMTRPGQADPRFSLTSVYLPNGRDNLASFMSVNSEATDENFGKLQILQLPSNTQVPGPNQIANQFSADRGVTQALLQFRQSDAQILNGNLLTLPVGEGLLYVQPVYIRRSQESGSYPVLQFVAASFGEDVGFGQTLDEALRVALGLSEGSIPDADEDGGDDGGGEQAGKTPSQYLADASKRYSEAQKSLRDGNLADYQKKIRAMNDAIEDAQDALKDQK